MTGIDNVLWKTARRTPYWDYKEVHELIEMAETDECREKLTAIRDLLYEIYLRGR